jgi:UrcA family protein
MITRLCTHVALGLSLAVAAVPSHAAPSADVRLAQRVSLAGLDLDDAKDAAVAYRRLVRASRAVCAYSSAPQTYSTACASRALAEVVERLGAPALDALHRERRG